MEIGALLDGIKQKHNIVWDRQMAAMLKVTGRDVTQCVHKRISQSCSSAGSLRN